MPKTISKFAYLRWRECPTRGWNDRHLPQSPIKTADQFRRDEGVKVQEVARSLFPDGMLVADLDVAQAVETTQRLMADATVSSIFEAAFHVDGYTARADILVRVTDGWKLIEVKSNLNDNDDLVEDLAYTAMVIKRFDVLPVSASLYLISKDYRLGMPDESLFVEIDHTADVAAKVAEFEQDWDEAKAIASDVRPEPELILACKGCPHFKEGCLGEQEENHIFDLPRISRTKFLGLTGMGITTIPEIPDDFELTPRQSVVRAAVVSGQPVVSPNLQAELRKMIWPAYYLDFETVKTVMPLYDDVAPHEQVPTQYSLHVCSAPGQIEQHREFLADPLRDCRREMAEQLLDDLDTEGSIVVYTSFEKRILNYFAGLFPDLAAGLQACVDRLYDLEAVIRNNYYAPGFHGRTSIKRVLPVVVPELQYDGMAIGDGDTAVAEFARMARGEVPDEEAEQIRKNLLAYCKLDTLAMVKLHERLYET